MICRGFVFGVIRISYTLSVFVEQLKISAFFSIHPYIASNFNLNCRTATISADTSDGCYKQKEPIKKTGSLFLTIIVPVSQACSTFCARNNRRFIRRFSNHRFIVNRTGFKFR